MQASFENRKSVRKYSRRDIPEELLHSLFEKAFRAPNTGNMQAYSVIITRDEEKKQQLAPFHFNQPALLGAPVILTFCADFYRFSRWCKLRNAHPGYHNFLSFLVGTTDALLFAEAFCVLAEGSGLGTCFLGTVNYNADEIAEVLQLPELVVPVATLTVGYPDEQPAETDRLPLEAIVHHESYNTEQDISALYQAKEAREDSQQFVQESHKETLAQVFTDIRYTQASNEHISAKLLHTLQKQKFW